MLKTVRLIRSDLDELREDIGRAKTASFDGCDTLMIYDGERCLVCGGHTQILV